ncbi:MAG: NAD(P)-dependent alcohol dehydrogenase [Gemmatimonadetes bacterium]|nr:NAD(P)-dependent alcohol dehydrogenase [Gemmatimonadota bacterium]
MKAIVYRKYGPPDVLELRDVDKPAVEDDEVLVRIHAAATNPYDWHFMRGEPYFMRLFTGVRAPRARALGADFAGEVEDTGRNVSEFLIGDKVYGLAGGAFAEYVSVPANEVAMMPRNLTYEQAAAVPMAGLTALQALRDVGRLERGESVLIIGASGGVGSFAVQIARAFHACVTGVCSTGNLDFVRSLGAGHVIDYTQQDCTETGRKYDLILQLGGTSSASHLRRALTPRGRLVLSSGDARGHWVGPLGRFVRASMLSPFVTQTLRPVNTQCRKEDLQSLTELIESGRVKPVVAETHTLSHVPEAIREIEEGHVPGKVVITV